MGGAKRIDKNYKSIIDIDYNKTIRAEVYSTPSKSTGEKKVVRIILSEVNKNDLSITEKRS